MKRIFLPLICAAAAIAAYGVVRPRSERLSEWLYPVNPRGAIEATDDGAPRRLPDSQLTFSSAQLGELFAAPDWYPGEHPPMPALVALGARPHIYACGYCHLPTGAGRPENASLAGLPAPYILKQMRDIKSGARRSSVPNRAPVTLMQEVSLHAGTDPGLEDAAAYFASIPPKPAARVVEADVLPRVEIGAWIWKRREGGETEPLGHRLIETPDDFERFEKRDPHATFTAFVPVGSLARGAMLVKTGGDGRTLPCARCHGPDLKGLGLAPPLAGRSPSYLARQIFDMKSGARNGEGVGSMRGAVTQLTNDDVIAVVAYVASLTP